ncbi:MAG: MarP family serine protease [Thermoleophilia bacterium]|nr:MarP family serine protease [Thermoleophilia bacterium]
MGAYDIGAVAMVLVGVALGVRRGGVRIALPLGVLVAGVALVDRFEARVLDVLGNAVWAPLVLVGGLLVAVAVAAAAADAVGDGRPLGPEDRVLGAVLGAGLGVMAVWLAAALVDASGPRGREAVGRSAVAVRLLEAVPPDAVLERLARLDDIPVISTFVPTRQPPQDPGVVAPRAVLDRVRASVVRIDTDACGGRWLGTGWVAAPGVVVTNAHVVAGEDRPRVTDAGDGTRTGTVVYADLRNDVAVVRVDGLDVPALPIGADPAYGAQLVFTGHPDGGPLSHRPATSGGVESTFTRDAVGRPAWRPFLVLRGIVRPGNSGGPVTDGRGRLVGMISAGDGDRLGFAVPVAQLRAALAAPRAGAAVPCSATPG